MQSCWQLFKKLLSFSYLCRLERWREALVEETQEIGVPNIRHDKRHRILYKVFWTINIYCGDRRKEAFFSNNLWLCSAQKCKNLVSCERNSNYFLLNIYMASFKNIHRVPIASFTIFIIFKANLSHWILNCLCGVPWLFKKYFSKNFFV